MLNGDKRFWREQKRYRLRYTCETCAFFDPPTGLCAHGWPNDEHRDAWYGRQPERIVFCKEFELG